MQISVRILLVIFSALACKKYDYRLSHGRKMWQGALYGLHYVDHFSLLTQRVPNIKGAINSYTTFGYNDLASLSFDVKTDGVWGSPKDGYGIFLMKSSWDHGSIDAMRDSKQSFELNLPKFVGFAVFVTGADKNQLYFGFITGKDARNVNL